MTQSGAVPVSSRVLIPESTCVAVTLHEQTTDDSDVDERRVGRRAPRGAARRRSVARDGGSKVTGRRSYRNTLALLRDIANRMEFERLPLIVTDEPPAS